MEQERVHSVYMLGTWDQEHKKCGYIADTMVSLQCASRQFHLFFKTIFHILVFFFLDKNYFNH